MEQQVAMSKNFETGTIIRCNRCNAWGPSPKSFRAVRENSNAWRIQSMMAHPRCGHLDAHWVFNSDIAD